ncbi:MAG TPA: hypothetical protein EYP77_06730 [Anaerolineae bacterium]|nr:hypothetical protein [Anaerolineae bacterium]
MLSRGGLLAAPLAQGDQVIILSPGDGATVSGAVEIIGTVTHPNFVSYGVLYAPGPAPTADSQWVEVVFGVQEQVENGVLAVWDTTARTEDGQPVVPNGVYTLALARYRQGSDTPDLFFVRNVTVNNEEVTPTPTLTPLPPAVPATPTAVPVEQPPTPTPRPSPTPRPGETPAAAPIVEEDEGGGLAFDVGRLRAAFFDGARITLLLFGLWGLYVFGKAAVRYYLRTRRPGPPGRR